MYLIKILFGILVIVNVNAIKHVILVSIEITKTVHVKKGLVDKLVEECNETIDEEVEIIDNNKNKYNSCIV